MINNNKILTVSYGTFSCTLEGFDDSFGTMKAIAEYFRDLAADDRYFGAEPAQPDAQMLASIAQREISRHVEAREDKGRIVLSAKRPDSSPAALVARDVVEDVAEKIAEEAVAKAPDVETPAKPAPQAPTQIADAVDVVVPEQEHEATDHARAQVQEDTPVAAEYDDAPDTAQADPEEDDPEDEIVPEVDDAEVEAFFADGPEAHADDLQVAPVEETVEAPEQTRAKADSIAEKLKRIRAVVSQQAEAPAAPDYSEDQHADATTLKSIAPEAEAVAGDDLEAADEVTSEDMMRDTLRDIEDALDADDVLEAREDDAPEEDESEDDDIAALLSRLESEADADDAEDDADEIAEYDDIEDDDDLDDDIMAAMDSLDAATDDDIAQDAGEDDNLFEGETDTDAPVTPEAAAEAAPAPEPAEPARPAVRTRVLKVKRATLDAAIKAGQLEEYDDEEPRKAAAPAAPLRKTSTLSPEAEDELARELAELEADMKAPAPKAPAQTPADTKIEKVPAKAETEASVPAKDTQQEERSELHGDAEDDLSRLMDETEQQMDEPEGATRRDAFAHLRAAVAAKKADEAVGGSTGDQDTDEPYRDDLANVVRPRRPVSSNATRTERPAEQRPAPLKLVAEQRIDLDEVRKANPVRPRRVAAMAPAAGDSPDPGASSFADFAAEMGAEKLPDLLEAAAAYLSFVEDHAEFSRPQLMNKVRQVAQEDFTREDSLRSFGKLLREGKIEKLTGGRFQASDHIGFKPDARAAG